MLAIIVGALNAMLLALVPIAPLLLRMLISEPLVLRIPVLCVIEATPSALTLMPTAVAVLFRASTFAPSKILPLELA